MSFDRSSYRGVLVPLVTPFRDEHVDLAALGALVNWLLERGVTGFVALGTTGEAPHLDDGESDAVVRAVVEAVAGRVPVLAGSGRPSTHGTIAASRRLARAGADAVLVLTPYYYRARMDAEALRSHYAAVADAVPVPVFVYHMPEVTGLELEAATLAEMVAHPNVWGFKDSSAAGGPLAATLERVRTCGLVGSGARLLEGLEAGARGGILAVAHAVPEACTDLHEAWRAGDRARAGELQERVAALARALRGWGVAGLKHALAVRGCPAGASRAPLAPPPAAVRQGIEAALRALVPGGG
jgi:dihydrodipicolinate synthase/N-acetylneuraminate lyase